MTTADIPDEIWDFINELTPGDVGVQQIGDFMVRFEGFSGECIFDAERRMKLPKNDPDHISGLQDLLDDVEGEFKGELGQGFLLAGQAGEEDQPIMYAIGHLQPELVANKDEEPQF